MAYTLFDKIWNEHVVSRNAGFPDTIYIDEHIINKITSPGAFEGLRKRHIPVFRPNQTIVLAEPDFSQHFPLSDLSRFQIDLLNRNHSDFGLKKRVPNQPDTLTAFPGQIIVCNQEQTTDIGAFGAIAIGINELFVEQVLATQCLLIRKPKRMKIEVNGRLAKGVGVKDINHYLLSEISAGGAKGYYVEYAGDTILDLDMEGRMAICNMSREIGAVGGLIAPDETTIDYITKLGIMPDGDIQEDTFSFRKDLYSDESSVFDEVLEFDAEDIGPGNYGIGLSKLITSSKTDIRSGMITDKGAAIIAGYNDTDYLLSSLDSIEEYERLKVNKIFDGA